MADNSRAADHSRGVVVVRHAPHARRRHVRAARAARARAYARRRQKSHDVKRPERVWSFDDRERELFYGLTQGVRQLADNPAWKAIMKDAAAVNEAISQSLVNLITSLPPSLRLQGLKPEERLAGLDAEQRLAGLDPSQAVLALPIEVLRGLSESYLATLPDDILARVRERLAE